MFVELGVLYSTNYRFFGYQNFSFEVKYLLAEIKKKKDNVTITWNQSLRCWVWLGGMWRLAQYILKSFVTKVSGIGRI